MHDLYIAEIYRSWAIFFSW